MFVPSLLSLALLPTTFAQLNTLAKAKGKYFGSATDNPELSDAPYKKILSDTSEFGWITVGNTQKWQYIEPSQGSFDYSQGDVIANLAAANGQKLRCHTLVWHNQLPNWVSSGSWTNATLIAAMKNHIQQVVTHYKGKCSHWDVVNEAFEEDGTYRKSVFYNVIGPEYIPIAFKTAATYDSAAKLYFNDYNLEYGGAKTAAARALVSSLKARGIKIDGIGLQGHLIAGSTPGKDSLTSVLNGYTALGVDVAYTEVDIRISPLPASTASLNQQATDYVSVLGSCLAVSRCVGFTVWDYTDKYSWIPAVFSGQGAALPWSETFVKKPAYFAMVTALGGTAAQPTTTKAATTTSTKKTTTTTAAAGGGGGVSPKWGQCGGQGWTGPTACVAGTTCVFSNAWYSQCL